MACKRIRETVDPSPAYLFYGAIRPIAGGLLVAACSSGANDAIAPHGNVHGASTSRSTSSAAATGTSGADAPAAGTGGAGNAGPGADAGTTTSSDDLGSGGSNGSAGVPGDAAACTGGANGGTGGANGGTGGTTPSAGGAYSGAGGVSAGAGGAATGGAATGGAAGNPSSQMDATAPPGAGGAPDQSPRPKRVFITHARWDGNLVLGAASFGIQVNNGLAGADAICNWVALDAALGGHWVAWLSDSTHDAIDRIQDVGPWYRMDGLEAFHDKAALTGNPLVPIQIDETRSDTEAVPTLDGIANIPWTGTLAGGTRSPSTCHDWVDNSASDVGLCGANTATTDRQWSDLGKPPCNRPYHLYCFEQ